MKRTSVTERKAIYKVIIIFYVTLNSAAEVDLFHLILLLGLQQVQAVSAHFNPPPDALRQALLTASSPCRFPGTSLKGDTNAIYRFLEHAWPPCAVFCRDAPSCSVLLYQR
jgi:hypothetical protein